MDPFENQYHVIVNLKFVTFKFPSSYRASMYYQKYLTDFLTSIGKKDIPLEEVTEDFGKSYKAT